MSSSNLHHRNKAPPVHASSSDPEAAQISVIAAHSKNNKLRRVLFISSEIRWALLAVVSFLAFGLLLGFFLLHHQHRKVILHVMKDPWAHGGAVLRGRAGFRHHFYTGQPRFVTVVMPSVVNENGRQQRLEAIQDTWGPYARAIYVVHNVSEFPAAVQQHAVISNSNDGMNVKLPYDPYSFPQVLEVPSGISVKEGIPRLYHTIQTIHEVVNPDFAFFVNDHTFVLPEHLCKYLELQNPDHDLYAGHALRSGSVSHANIVFNSGAAGYILSRATMEKMVQKHKEKDPACSVGYDTSSSLDTTDTAPKDKTVNKNEAWLQNNPGLATLECLNKIGVFAIDTRSAKKWHRFHAFPLTRMVSGDIDKWYNDKHVGMSGLLPDFDASYETSVSTTGVGEACCSETSISFHYVESMEARALFAIRQALLTNPHMPDQELTLQLQAEWPKTKSELGVYSRPLPKPEDKQAWQQLLIVLRHISSRETQTDC